MIANIVAHGRDEMNRVITLPPELDRRGLDAEQRRALVTSKEYKAAVEKLRDPALAGRKAAMEAIDKVLTRAQCEMYEKLLGEPFDFARMRTDSAPVEGAPKPKSL
jgi:hypothetical protein